MLEHGSFSVSEAMVYDPNAKSCYYASEDVEQEYEL